MSQDVSTRSILSLGALHEFSLRGRVLIRICLVATIGIFLGILQADEQAVPSVSAAVPDSATVVDGIKVPDGFHVELYADDDLAHDVHSMTIDSKGCVVVSGPGYIRILIDSNNDGRADTFKQFADKPDTGSQGMFFLGSSLLCSGDQGLQIFRDDNHDDVADGPPQVGAMFGWLGDFDTIDYMHRAKAKRDWVHGFGIGYHDTITNYVYIAPVPIINGTCCVEGKVYKL